MPDVMIRCPVELATISTGLSTDTVQFESLPNCAVPLQCQACGGVHFWRPGDAWVHGSPHKPARRNGQASD
jgi:hypothetical protein